MALVPFTPAGLSILSVVAFLVYVLLPKKSKLPPGTKKLPGPKGIPILGSVPELPAQHAWLQFCKWSKEYGPICQVKLGPDTIILVSDIKIAEELLVRRQALYSSRVHFAAIWGDCTTDVHYLPLMAAGADHKRAKLFAKKFVASIPKAHSQKVTAQHTKVLIKALLENPTDWQNLFERCCGGISSTIAWGDERPETARETIRRSNELLEGISPESIENKLPFLESVPSWVPSFLQPWRVEEKARKDRERAFWFGQRADALAQIEKGKIPPTWTEATLKDDTLDEVEKAYMTGMLALIGSVLESVPLQAWIIAMVHFPEWQKRAQEEVDAVCGDRMPSADDIQNLPVVRALIRETFRWRTPVPFGVPHKLVQDDVYDGYHIPKGSLCMALEWAMMRDPVIYPDPENYRPDRWLDPSFPTYKEPLTLHPMVKGHSGFGWGKRTCVGQDYTEAVLVTIIASILWSCNIQKKIDEKTGLPIEVPWMDYGPFVIVKPNPCPLDIVPRNEWRIQALSV